MMDGVGGTHFFRLEALCEGDTVLCFTYSQGQERDDDFHQYVLARVEPDLTIHVFDISNVIRKEAAESGEEP